LAREESFGFEAQMFGLALFQCAGCVVCLGFREKEAVAGLSPSGAK
jgi:hypothetical protein